MSERHRRLARPRTPRSAGPGPWAAFALLVVLVLSALYPTLALANSQIVATRLWPAQEYTRVTLEADAEVRHTLFSVPSPPRLVLDLEGVEPNAHLDALPGRVSPDDPHLAAIRVGRFKPGVLRVVFDLKQEVRAEVFTLAPVADYGHRLVLDLYPSAPADPLMALVQESERRLRAGTPARVSVDPSAQQRAAPSDQGRSPGAYIGPRMITIAIDPGHGGEDPGAIGRLGTYEKDITLAIARRLKELIDAEPNLRGVLIRDGDYFVSLGARVQRARRIRADLFVSIHADAFIKPHARGSSVFALSERGATSAAASWLARKENQADLIGGINLDVPDPYLKQTLLDLSQTATINDSLKLARHVLHELGQVNTLHKAHVEQAGFAVLKAPDIPSILVETAFISNPEEERRLRDQAYQRKMAAAILNGIRRYLAANPPLARPPHVAYSESQPR